MYIQCLDCRKKLKVKSGSIPYQGAVVSCPGCGGKLKVAPRDNQEADMTKIPVNKRKHKKEVKWHDRMTEMIRGFGYQSKTHEFNMLFSLMKEYRKRFGITFFDITCSARLAHVDRELAYNVLEFSGKCCVPPANGFESCVASMIEGTSEVLNSKDSTGRYTVEPVMRVQYPDSFPALIKFSLDAAFETSYGEVLYGNAVRIDLSLDNLRSVRAPFDGKDLVRYARIEMARYPVDTGRLTFAQRTTPGLHVHTEPDPELRCGDPDVLSLIEQYS
ncbi:hypothetical protein [Desulfovibrio ferrophilus]|uniref:Zinc finger/thioredoxin putative domain-containing protein n=1 Tax=Desulfovibrio ferrophilus TaxID=241368 RepID=A0A2Z6AY81_9BACT|nr:hypothetical protein [Desulfovibrio ferrophilus]BBD08178.1 uncharacterized protein DFE_1452 [Desulfovibrio ferrophilus]